MRDSFVQADSVPAATTRKLLEFNPEDVARVWATSKSVSEVSRRLGKIYGRTIPESVVRAQVDQLRADGVKLERAPHGWEEEALSAS